MDRGRRGRGPPQAGAWAESELRGSHGDSFGRSDRSGARRQKRRGHYELRRGNSETGRCDGRRGGNDSGSASGSHISRWHQTRHHSRSDSLTTAGAGSTHMKPGEYFLNEAAGPVEANAGGETKRGSGGTAATAPG